MNLSLQHSFQILIKGNKYDEDEMVCTGGINRPCQGDGGAPLVCFKLKSKKKKKLKILKLTFLIDLRGAYG